MAFQKYLLPVLAVATAVGAQKCSGPLTINSSADASALSSCATFKGDVIISAQASGTISIDGVQQITGSVRCENAGAVSEISASDLGTIGGIFYLQNLTTLSSLNFGSLNNVNEIYWVGLPALQSLNFAQGVSQANNVLISNTELNSLSGIELETVGNMDINNNPFLTSVNVNDITNLTGSLNFAANAASLEIAFQNLQQANNMSFRNASSVSMPSLSAVNGSLGFYSGTFESFSAPNLTITGGTLAFVDCPSLSNISFPQLKEIGGGFLIANNTQLKTIDGFPDLQTIVGALDFAGTFNKANLPSLKDLRGGLNVQTTSTTFDCTQLQGDKNKQIIKGVFTCASGQSHPNTNPNGATSGASPSSTNGAGASNFDPSTPLTGFGALLAALFMI